MHQDSGNLSTDKVSQREAELLAKVSQLKALVLHLRVDMAWLENRDRACLEIHFQPKIGLMVEDRWRIHKNGTGYIGEGPTLHAAIESARAGK